MIISKTISTAFDLLKRRITKIQRFGNGKDVQTGVEIAPYGTDANPIAGMRAIYADTAQTGKTIIIGYVNVNQLAAVGEHRIYSTDENGGLKFHVWLKNDGTIEIGGNAGHMTRFEELETGFNQLKADHNAFLTHVHGGPGTPPTPPATPSNADISGAKINEVKTL